MKYAIIILSAYLATMMVAIHVKKLSTDQFIPPQAHLVLSKNKEVMIAAPNSTKPTKTYSNSGKPTQAQKDITAAACRAHFTGGLATQCYYDLLSIAKHETGFDCSRKGDFKNGVYRSRGCFQIQTKLHNISIEQAEDYAFAVNWTLKRLIGKGYASNLRSASLKSHNGAGPSADRYLMAVKAISLSFKMQGL